MHFDRLFKWIEQEVECYTIKELHQEMMEIANCATVYTTNWLKKKLIERYDKHVFFAELKEVRCSVSKGLSMSELPEKHHWLHQCFQEKGYHTIISHFQKSECLQNVAITFLNDDVSREEIERCIDISEKVINCKH